MLEVLRDSDFEIRSKSECNAVTVLAGPSVWHTPDGSPFGARSWTENTVVRPGTRGEEDL